MLRVGLTGGIACGKSRVLRRLVAAGCHPVDLDRIAHEVMAPGGEAYGAVVAAFGRDILAPDGSVDRKALGALVFSDASARLRLNAIVHPRVREEAARRSAAFTPDPSAIVVTDAALLVESGIHLRFDRLVVVHCSPEQQLRRLVERDGMDAAAARARIGAQMPVGEKRRFAHFEVDASGRIEETDRAADRLAAELQALSLALAQRTRVRLPLERALGCLVHGPRAGPRGLDPGELLGEIASAGGIELERLGRRLVPPPDGPWYAPATAPGPHTTIPGSHATIPGSYATIPGPETLVGPLVLWALARAAPDEDYLLGAAASLARLTHGGAPAVGRAGVFACALLEAAVTGRAPRESTWPAWAAAVDRFGGVATEADWGPVARAVARHSDDLGAAREACAQTGGAPDLAGALVGMIVGVPTGVAPETLLTDLRALDAMAQTGPKAP